MNSEKELIQQLRALETIALTSVYDQFNDAIFRYAYRLLGDQDRAEECVAETFSRFLHALHQGKGPRDAVRPYLYRIAHNWITDYYRRPGQEQETLSELIQDQCNNPEAITTEKLEQTITRNALNKLPPNQRQVIVLKFLEEWENNEIAESLNKPVGAIKALQNRGLRTLNKILKVKDNGSETY